jgi:hypothetical protein
VLAAAQVRDPNVPIVFCETRSLAQEWTYRVTVTPSDQHGCDGEAEPATTRRKETTPASSIHMTTPRHDAPHDDHELAEELV